MTTSRKAWLAALLVPVVVVGGLTGAVVANAESVSQVRVAQSHYADAWEQAVAVHEHAESALRDAAALALRADQLLYTATTYQSLAHLNPESLAALVPLVEALESALAVEGPVSPPLPAQLDSRVVAELDAETDALRAWNESVEAERAAAPVSGVPDALVDLDSALRAVADGVAASGDSLLASKVGASAETRVALSDAMAAVAASITDGGSTFASVWARAGRTIGLWSRPMAACSAPPTRPKENMPVSTEPASQRRLTRRRSGGPLPMLRV